MTAPGVSAALVDESGREVGQGSGLLALTRPWPSMLRTLYNDPDRYVQTYFGRFGPGTYCAGDGARRNEDSYFWITGRLDDVINVSGHRLSTAEIESALVSHPAVAEAAVIASADDLTGQAVVAYVTLGSGAVPEADLETMLREHVGRQIGKLARPSRIIWADDLPKTRSGEDHAQAPARHRGRPRARRRDHAARRVGPGAAPAQCPCRPLRTSDDPPGSGPREARHGASRARLLHLGRAGVAATAGVRD
jgi:non-ribosomal peptide synthetase component E (peptide arylation enzyme)